MNEKGTLTGDRGCHGKISIGEYQQDDGEDEDDDHMNLVSRSHTLCV